MSEAPSGNKRARRRGTLQGKLVRTIVVLLALMGAIVLTLVILVQMTVSKASFAVLEGQIREAVMSQGMGLATSQATLFRSLAADNALTEMHNAVALQVLEDDDVVYGLFVGHEGQPWTYCSPFSPPHLLGPGVSYRRTSVDTVEDELELPRAEFQVLEPMTRSKVLFGREVLEFAVPVQAEGENLGTLRFGISTERMHRLLNEARAHERALRFRVTATVGLVVLLTLVLGALAALRAARRIAQPVRELTGAASRLAARDTEWSVHIHSNDELEALGETFNRMAFDLQTSYEALEERNEELAREVEDRRRAESERSELQAHLVQSQKMEAFGQLAGGVAHDFNNILSVVVGNANLLEDELAECDCPAEMRDLVSDIAGAAERGSNLTRQLLTFARRGANHPRIVGINEVVQSFQKLIRRVVEEHVELAVAPGPDAPRVEVDPGSIEQVLMNLCVNARDAMPSGGKLTVSTARVRLLDACRCATGIAPAGVYAEIRVQDTGMGISPDVMQRIFEPFFTTKAAGHGTGLGLATVHGIVQSAGGYIDVESVLGRGTTFRVLLPARDVKSVQREARHERERLRGNGERILICEDEPGVRDMTARMLRRGGYATLVAATPEEALALVRQTTVDLLLTDVVMPGLNGRELAEQVREIAAGVRVLFMSGYTAGILRSQGLGDHEDRILRKPYKIDDLLARVATALSKARDAE